MGVVDSPTRGCATRPGGTNLRNLEDLRRSAQTPYPYDAYLPGSVFEFTKDELLANITLYWVTETINSSVRLYYESMRSGRAGFTQGRVEVPTGCANFPKEIYRPPRSWVERHYNVTRWTEMRVGGHFAALEQPALLVDDIRAFFRELRS